MLPKKLITPRDDIYPTFASKGLRGIGAETMIISSHLHQDDNYGEASFSRHFDCHT